MLLNAAIGVFQENKAEKALDALKNLSAPHARVIRDGVERVIDASELVPGDVIRLEAGDFVPADARLIKSASLKSEESALTGESVPSEKDAAAVVAEDAALGDRANMVFSGCSITYGTATAAVTATGMDTEMGKIANLLENEDEGQTPLQKKLAQLGKYLGIMALAACAIIFVVGLLNGIAVMENLHDGGLAAVSAIPEGLPAIVTVVLSIGVQRMVKKNANHPPPARGRDAGQRLHHLLGQDRHADAEPHDAGEGVRYTYIYSRGHLQRQLRFRARAAAAGHAVLGRLRLL